MSAPLSTRGLFLLSATAIRHLKSPGWHNDGGGLYVEVSRSGSKRWVMRLSVNGRRRDFGLGSLRYISLQQARVLADDYRLKARAGFDPIAHKRSQSGVAAEDIMTFERAADEAHKARQAEWKNGKHVQQWIHTLRDYAFPKVGHKAISDITTADVLAVLSPIWSTKPETARRVRQRLKIVFEWARAAGQRSGDNPIDLIGQALPRQRHRVAHHQALPFAEVASFLTVLGNSAADDITKRAFAFLILTAARTTEVRFATWSEINLVEGLWIVPAARMKGGREHVVPLPSPALTILRKVHSENASGLIFADGKTGAPISNVRFLNARSAIGYGDRCTPHGFRSSFRDWAAEETVFPAEVVEMALAHTIRNKTEAAYRRGDLLTKRRQLMEAWANFVVRTSS